MLSFLVYGGKYLHYIYKIKIMNEIGLSYLKNLLSLSNEKASEGFFIHSM